MRFRLKMEKSKTKQLQHVRRDSNPQVRKDAGFQDRLQAITQPAEIIRIFK